MAGQERAERAIRYTYDAKTHMWDQDETMCIIEKRPFQAGCMRTAHRMWEIEQDGSRSGWVAKFSKMQVTPDAIFEDARLSMIAQEYAEKFNRVSGVEKKVAFLPSYVLKLPERGGMLCCAEPCLSGEYLKHNNNDGVVATARAVPQAFSHFTYEASKRKILVCDIQGVGDYYTDPQILSADGQQFGAGNIGMEGILKFMRSHVCNDICKHMKLPALSTTGPTYVPSHTAAYAMNNGMLVLQPQVPGQYPMQQMQLQATGYPAGFPLYPGQPVPAQPFLNQSMGASLHAAARPSHLGQPVKAQPLGNQHMGSSMHVAAKTGSGPSQVASLLGDAAGTKPKSQSQKPRTVSSGDADSRRQIEADEALARKLQAELHLSAPAASSGPAAFVPPRPGMNLSEDERLARQLQMSFESGGQVPPPLRHHETEDEILARRLQEEFNRMDAVPAARNRASQRI